MIDSLLLFVFAVIAAMAVVVMLLGAWEAGWRPAYGSQD